MATTYGSRHVVHPLHAAVLASAVPLFLGAMLSDWAYSSTYEIQWSNFASWLIVGALVLTGFALVWAVIEFLRADVRRDRRGALFILVLGTAWVLGFINALVHAKDGWATMPAGLILSVLVFLLALAAAWIGFATLRAGDAK